VTCRDNTAWLRERAFQEGAALFGVTAFGPFSGRTVLSDAESSGLDWAVSLAVALSPPVLEGCVDGPTLLYKWHYRQANNLLDKIAFRLSQTVLERGFRALPIPASQIVDWNAQTAHLSHRAVAERAGLGWRGRNNLIVNERFGAGLRLATVLTDLPLESVESPPEFGCGSCRACVVLCPAQALGETPAHYRLDFCLDQLVRFSKERALGVSICGVCVRACSNRVGAQGK
jgi:epoxyqueuosine reductase QueG